MVQTESDAPRPQDLGRQRQNHIYQVCKTQDEKYRANSQEVQTPAVSTSGKMQESLDSQPASTKLIPEKLVRAAEKVLNFSSLWKHICFSQVFHW